jgi:hypothetical protein
MTIWCSSTLIMALSAFDESLIYCTTNPLCTTFFFPDPNDTEQWISCRHPLCKIYHFTRFFDLQLKKTLLRVQSPTVLHHLLCYVNPQILKSQTVHLSYNTNKSLKLPLFIFHIIPIKSLKIPLFIFHIIPIKSLKIPLFIFHIIPIKSLKIPLFIFHIIPIKSLRFPLFMLIFVPLYYHCIRSLFLIKNNINFYYGSSIHLTLLPR